MLTYAGMQLLSMVLAAGFHTADALSAFAYCLQVCMPEYVSIRMPAYVSIRSCMPADALSAFAYHLQVCMPAYVRIRMPATSVFAAACLHTPSTPAHTTSRWAMAASTTTYADIC
jgi:predicted amidohydrolase